MDINARLLAAKLTEILDQPVLVDTLRDFAPVAIFSESENILVTSATKPYRSVRELIEAARAKPGALSYASAGSGSTQHLGAELFKQRTGTDILHVPHKGSAPAITALIAGELTWCSSTFSQGKYHGSRKSGCSTPRITQ